MRHVQQLAASNQASGGLQFRNKHQQQLAEQHTEGSATYASANTPSRVVAYSCLTSLTPVALQYSTRAFGSMACRSMTADATWQQQQQHQQQQQQRQQTQLPVVLLAREVTMLCSSDSDSTDTMHKSTTCTRLPPSSSCGSNALAHVDAHSARRYAAVLLPPHLGALRLLSRCEVLGLVALIEHNESIPGLCASNSSSSSICSLAAAALRLRGAVGASHQPLHHLLMHQAGSQQEAGW
jgi:hypothetical protein